MPVNADRRDQRAQRDVRDPGRGVAGAAHCLGSIRRWARRTPARNCCSNTGVAVVRLLGKARMTIRSAGCSSSTTARAACRSRRATRCRSTDPPTDFATINPISGAPLKFWSAWRRACTTMADCGARTPLRTASPNSADRLIRYLAGSTVRCLDFRRSENRGLCGAVRSRSPGPLESACATESHGPWPADGCSAGMSVCPWPRRSLLITVGSPDPVVLWHIPG